MKILKQISRWFVGVSMKENQTDAEYLVLNKKVVKVVLTEEESKTLESLVTKIRGVEGVKNYKVSEVN